MPFTHGIMTVGGRHLGFTIPADRNTSFNVVAEILALYGTAPRPGDSVSVTLEAGVDLVATDTASYAIDGDGLEDCLLLNIIFTATSIAHGRGGKGGKGGNIDAGPGGIGFVAKQGANGAPGGAAIRCGCRTILSGTGTVRKGFGGGGGGDGEAAAQEYGGGGGGGGAPLGLGGDAGLLTTTNASGIDGQPGTAATVTTRGQGGNGGSGGNDGGDGGDSTISPQDGDSVAGADGNAIEKQGWDLEIGAGVTVVGVVV